MKHHCRILPTLLIFCVLLSCFVSCGGGSSSENVSDRAVAYMEKAIDLYVSSSYSSVIDLFAKKTVRTDLENAVSTVLITIDYDCRSYRTDKTVTATAKLAAGISDAASAAEGDFTPLFTYEYKNDLRTYRYEGVTEPSYATPKTDLIASIGAQTVQNKSVSSFFAVKDEGVVRVNLTFRQAEQAQFPVIALLTKLTLGLEQTAGKISSVSIDAEIDEATGAFLNYTLSYTYTPQNDENALLSISVSEHDFTYPVG